MRSKTLPTSRENRRVTSPRIARPRVPSAPTTQILVSTLFFRAAFDPRRLRKRIVGRKPVGLRLPGKVEKIREVVCSLRVHGPIRGAWPARAAEAGGSEAPRRKHDPRDKRIEKLEREIAKLNEDLARTSRDRDRWKRRSENLKKQLDEARRAAKTAGCTLRQGPAARVRQAARPTARGGVRATRFATLPAEGSTRPTGHRCRRRVPTAVVPSR